MPLKRTLTSFPRQDERSDVRGADIPSAATHACERYTLVRHATQIRYTQASTSSHDCQPIGEYTLV